MVDVKKIEQLLRQYFTVRGVFNIDKKTGEIDGFGDVWLDYKISEMPVQFSRITGNFYASSRGLTTLKGSPRQVTGSFWCDQNKLTSLMHAPLQVGNHFRCGENQLQDLAHAPIKVGGSFSCEDNQLISLRGAPRKVPQEFDCSGNQLTNLAGAPHHVGDSFDCKYNPLTSLSGAPAHVGSAFTVTYLPQLPLLSLCVYRLPQLQESPQEIRKILDKYADTGRPGALLAAAELIRAGYRENARW